MAITIDRDAKMLRIGRRRFDLHVDSDGEATCEPDAGLALSDLKRISGHELPDRLVMELTVKTQKYKPLRYISIRRKRRSLEIYAVCIYDFNKWHEPVHLKDFYARFMHRLQEVAGLSVEDFADFSSNQIDLQLRMKAATEGFVGAHCAELIEAVRLKHAEVLAGMTAGRPGMPARNPKVRRPTVFICHDWHDKKSVARPIAERLADLQCRVWYDEFSLRVGDRLRESIEKGLKRASKCILIISPHFLSNEGWSREEFDCAFARELLQGKDILLPVWVGVSKQQVFSYSSSLLNRFAANWDRGIDDVVRQIYDALTRR